MTDDDRQKLTARYRELEQIIDDIRSGVIAHDQSAELEAKCLKEQDEIDYWLEIFNWED